MIKTCRLVIGMMVLSLLPIGSRAQGQIAAHFPVIGNEREVTVDATTGRQMIFLTSSQYVDTQYYPHSGTWAENDRYVLIESIRPRPEGQTSDPTERQLLAADVQTGELYWLAPLEVEDTAQYGDAHVGMSSQYHADYAPGSNSIAYYDMTGHNLYLLDLDTGQRQLLWHVADGRIGDPTSISRDGSRIMIYVTYPGPSDTVLMDNRTTLVIGFDIDPATNELKRGPYIVYSYAERKTPPDANGQGTFVRVNHIQVNPANTDLVSFCHGYLGRPDGSVDKTRLWYAKTDGSMVKMLTVTPPGRIHTHEVWGAQGKHLYYVDILTAGAIRRVEVETGIDEELIGEIMPRCLHISVSNDEKRIVFDTQTAVTPDADGNRMEWIKLFEPQTGQVTPLAQQYASVYHPRHAHPNINGDGDKVAFCVATGTTSRVAYMTIE